jgi:hypothetical protein
MGAAGVEKMMKAKPVTYATVTARLGVRNVVAPGLLTIDRI